MYRIFLSHSHFNSQRFSTAANAPQQALKNTQEHSNIAKLFSRGSVLNVVDGLAAKKNGFICEDDESM
jgi:hypothetical protein